MAELNFDFDEGILLSADDVVWVSSNELSLEEMVLTNKNLYLTYKKSNGLFAKSTEEVVVKPLSSIKIINGQPMVSQKKDRYYGVCLQIQFMESVDQFAFYDGKKSTSAAWVNELYKVLVGTEAPEQEKAVSLGGFGSWKSSFMSAAETAMGTVSSAAGSAMGTVTEMAKQAAGDATTSFVNAKDQYNKDRLIASDPAILPKSGGSFCSNCGTKLDLGTKYCPGCGTPVGSGATPPVPSGIQNTTENPTSRQQEFAGKIIKCPNCGASIGQTMAICPECGYRITGQAAVSSVQNFSNQLMALESKRKRAGFGQMLGFTVDPVDTQKLSLIRSFPIPNTIDDIQEFMMLAIANIDVSLSKNTMMNKWQNTAKQGETSQTISKTISDAWVAKMQQVYQKAVAAFPNDPAFASIKTIYTEKMKELKMKIDF